MHLLGLDYYNNRTNDFGQRLIFLKREFPKTLVARMGRMTPAYGIGGVVNLKARTYMFGDLDRVWKH
jgi:hypothetical protein